MLTVAAVAGKLGASGNGLKRQLEAHGDGYEPEAVLSPLSLASFSEAGKVFWRSGAAVLLLPGAKLAPSLQTL